ncbi:MAG TPA: histidine phosphatase family protein [Actinomycetota bacterium]|nr:histidine phosphatase family protein [Actinomycetota bacterium]
MKTLEIRRHARRDPADDRLSAAGRAQAEDVGRTLDGGYDVVFVSPAQRAAETVAWMLRGSGNQLPPHAVVPGLAAKDNDGSPLAMAGVVSALLDAVPEGGHGLAVSHTPLIERAVFGLTAREVEQLGECEGVLLRKADAESPVEVEEIRLSR